jgi:hypothetical protein
MDKTKLEHNERENVMIYVVPMKINKKYITVKPIFKDYVNTFIHGYKSEKLYLF